VLYLIDTNVLLRFADRSHQLHPIVRDAVRQLRRDGHQLQIASQNCIEFWNVATRPIEKNGFGLPTVEAEQMLRLIEQLFPLLTDASTTYAAWRRLVLTFNISGVQVHDARLVATMIANNVSHILTFNTTDFVRYTPAGILAVNPVAVSIE
jgi:predicted nucleic acid-binding protein